MTQPTGIAVSGKEYTQEVPAPGDKDKAKQLVDDASLLLEHAVTQGKPVSASVTEAILDAQRLLGGGSPPSPQQWPKFVSAYRDLAELMRPVTARSLRATHDEGDAGWRLFGGSGVSRAKRWTRVLWRWALVFAVVIVVAENLDSILRTFLALDENTSGWKLALHIGNSVLQSIVPFAFGGFGAVAYLFRSAHVHIQGRTFDANYIPEYVNRLIVGMIAGGTIQLLIDSVTQDGEIIRLSSAALAFIAGYSAELLFRSIERITEALLPKAGVESVRRAQSPQISGISMTALLEQLDKAQTPEARAVIQGLLAKIKDRI